MALPPLSEMDDEVLDGRWYVHLRHSRSDEEIVSAVREFVASLVPGDIARLPIRCLDVTTGADIPRLSILLAQAFETLPPDSTDRAIYIRAIAMLCYATDRLSQVPEPVRKAEGALL